MLLEPEMNGVRNLCPLIALPGFATWLYVMGKMTYQYSHGHQPTPYPQQSSTEKRCSGSCSQKCLPVCNATSCSSQTWGCRPPGRIFPASLCGSPGGLDKQIENPFGHHHSSKGIFSSVRTGRSIPGADRTRI